VAEHRPAPESPGPIVAPRGASAANASHPDTALDPAYQIYEANPAPWWIGVLWVTFFLFAVVYLIRNLLAG
jgi:hypothetical protein